MKRFYREAAASEVPGGWQVMLDGRGVKTVGGAAQVVPTAALAEALAAEWEAQGEEIIPASFVLRDLADYALNVVSSDPAAIAHSLLRFAETDTLCYRAEPDEPLAARQAEVWEPLLIAAERRFDVYFERVAGVLHRPQPPATLARLEQVMLAKSAFELAALNTLASLAASLVIGLAALEPEADAEVLWSAANLEEDWQAEQWGEDYEAAALRERRLGIFTAAAQFARLAQRAR
jgi:chaperone required for assembly of F1-ATPase